METFERYMNAIASIQMGRKRFINRKEAGKW